MNYDQKVATADKLLESGQITKSEHDSWVLSEVDGTVMDERAVQKVEDLIDAGPPQVAAVKLDTLQHPSAPPKDPVDTKVEVINSHGDKGSSVQVSTNAMHAFAGKLVELERLVNDQHIAVKSVAIRPGTFGAGVYLTEQIQQGLRTDTLNFLQSVSDTFRYIRADMLALMTDYKTTEERSEMSAQVFGNAFNDTFSNVNSFSNYGNSSSDNVAGGTSNDNGNSNGNGNGKSNSNGNGNSSGNNA